ncbi:unnamed protein product [Staurois parvus]|uniref:Uncharacterized protein n=1 Tax=Staurois parvus TaxID=386267 RepID=A0ABN9CMY3_9NEOB|nr:unnamed protein product [Staurois parvus]
MVGVTGQVQQVASSIVQRVRQRDGLGHKPVDQNSSKQRRSEAGEVSKGTETGCRTDTGPRTNTTPKAESASLAIPFKYTSIHQFQVLAG